MESAIISGIVGFILAGILFTVIWFKKLKQRPKQDSSQIYMTIEKFRSVGELVVFKILMKEIIAKHDHWFGEKGKKYFQWLASNKKISLILEFEIDFRYNLYSPDFRVEEIGYNAYRLKMPKCLYEPHIKDISIYDEQDARIFPWLLGSSITKAFGTGFDAEAKTQLIKEAKSQAGKMASDYVMKMQSAIQDSTKRTLETFAKGFGAEKITVDFSDSDLIQSKVDYIPAETHGEDANPK